MKNGLIVIILVVLGVIAWYLFGLRQSTVDEAPPPPPIVEQAAPAPAPGALHRTSTGMSSSRSGRRSRSHKSVLLPA